MNKFKIERVEDCHHVFFRVWKDEMICFQCDSVEECEEYILEKRALKAVEMREYRDYELSKASKNYADKREMAIGYDNRDYVNKEEQDYHMINIYLDKEANDDGAIMYNVVDFKKGEFVAEFYCSIYSKKADEIIKEICPKVIRGEKELRNVIKLLEVRRLELLAED